MKKRTEEFIILGYEDLEKKKLIIINHKVRILTLWKNL